MKHGAAISALAVVLALLTLLSVTVFAVEPTTETTQPEQTTEATGTMETTEATDPEQTTGPERTTKDTEATEPEEPEEPELTDEQLIEKYGIKDDWARPALLFAVRNGILQGNEEGNLCPEDTATRGEIATILMRVIRTQTKADLSGFRDMQTSAWYYDYLSRAVAVGIFYGNEDGTMEPNASITREQAFAVLARTFGVTGGKTTDLYAFKDADKISSWAQQNLAAMVAAGYVRGDNNKRINPKGKITRQELAQVLSQILTQISEEVPLQSTGSVAVAADTLEPDTQAENLFLSNEAPEMTLDGVTVTGKLIVQGCGSLKLTLRNCHIGTLVLCRPAELDCDQAPEQILVCKAGTRLGGSLGAVQLYADATLTGKADSVAVRSGKLCIEPDAEAAAVTVEATAEGTTVTVNGSVQTLNVNGKNVTVDGSGTVKELKIGRDGCTVTCPVENRTEQIDPGLSQITAERTDSFEPTLSTPGGYISMKLSNVDTTTGAVADGKRPCAIAWYLEGKLVWSQANGRLYDGMEDKCYMDFSPYFMEKESVTVKLQLITEDEVREFTARVSFDAAIYEMAKNVRTENVQATVKYATGLYSSHTDTALTGYMTTVPANTQVTYETYYGTRFARIRLTNGKVGWVDYNAIRISGSQFYTTRDYSTAIKECWVNEVHNYSSSSKYLIWISLYTQKVNIFIGSKGNWKLYKACPAATGSNTTPTLVQNTTIKYRSTRWNYEAFYVDKISLFDYQGRAFHSLPKNFDGTIYNPTIGRPASHGCIRMRDEDCGFIYTQVPVGTTVIVY